MRDFAAFIFIFSFLLVSLLIDDSFGDKLPEDKQNQRNQEQPSMTIRAAVPEDAPDAAELIFMTGEKHPSWLVEQGNISRPWWRVGIYQISNQIQEFVRS